MYVDHNLINWKEKFQHKNSIVNLVGVQFHKNAYPKLDKHF
jgi:hypothetical protein